MHARVASATRTGRPFPATVAIALAMTLFCPPGWAQTPRQKRTSEARERRYRELLESAEKTAGELYRLGEWCLKTSTNLSEPERARYRERGAACFQRAESRVRDELVRVLAEAESGIRKATGYPEDLRIQNNAKESATDYLEPLLAIFEFQNSIESFRQVIEQGTERLEKVALPFRRREAERRVGDGEVFVAGRWQAVAQADRRIQFAGTIPFSVLRKSAKDYLGQLVCTNFVGHGKIHKLVDIHFLDGFDDRGEYIAPHFMNERTVLTLRADEPGWLKTLEYLRKNQHARSGENGYRFQVVVRMHQRWLQATGFFDAEVQQMAVFDDHNRLVEYLGPQPGESE